MDTPRLTDERLRHRLNADQAVRERLCLAVLSLDRGYEDVKPRRPEGGPDGGCDIEFRRNREPGVGAVGFVNNASDSADDRRAIQKKFRRDVDAARAFDKNARNFAFLTNVDLTPGTRTELIQYATDRDFNHVDIYWRERIRIALDSPEGLAFRYQYLGISLSEAEQASFFGRFGNQLEDLIRGKFDGIETRIRDLQFTTWRARPIRTLKVEFLFREYIDAWRDEDFPFRCALELTTRPEDGHGMLIGARDDNHYSNGRCAIGSRHFFWHQDHGVLSEAWIPQTGVRAFGGVVGKIQCGATWKPHSFLRGFDFDGLFVAVYLSENLLDIVDRVRLTADEFYLIEATLEGRHINKRGPLLSWPEDNSDQLEANPWQSMELYSIQFRDFQCQDVSRWSDAESV